VFDCIEGGRVEEERKETVRGEKRQDPFSLIPLKLPGVPATPHQ